MLPRSGDSRLWALLPDWSWVASALLWHKAHKLTSRFALLGINPVAWQLSFASRSRG